MSEEEKKAIEYFKEKIKNKLPLYEETYVDGKPFRRNFIQLETNFTEEQANKTEILLNLIEKQQKEIEELKEIIITIRHELKGNIITKDGENYAPAKNLTKQKVYESYVKLITLLKANYPFKEDDDVIKELLEK